MPSKKKTKIKKTSKKSKSKSTGLLKYMDQKNEITSSKTKKGPETKKAPETETKTKTKSEKGLKTETKTKIKKGPEPETKKEPEVKEESGAKAHKKTSKQVPSNVKITYFEGNREKFGEEIFEKQIEKKSREAQKSIYLRYLKENDMLCKNMEEGILLTVEYSGSENKAYCRFYDLHDQRIKFWIDNTGHQPYCIHRLSKEELEKNTDLMEFSGFDRIETIVRHDLMRDEEIEVSKIYVKTPSDVAGGGDNNVRAILEHVWEGNIRYHLNYIYDRELIPGLLYKIKDGNIELLKTDIDEDIESQFNELYKDQKPEFREMARKYLKIFSYRIPDIKRVAIDIEVDVPGHGMLPDTLKAKEKVISISFAASDGLMKVYVLNNKNLKKGELDENFPKDAEIVFFDKEKDLIEEAFRVIWSYPLVITFNGDNFDFNYLFHRAKRLKIPDSLNPIQIQRGGGSMVSSYSFLKYGVHLDLYQVFSNRSLKAYAFGKAYDRSSLDAISNALLGMQKIKHQEAELEGVKFSASDIANLDLYTLAYYNLMDSILTLKLTQYGNNTVWNLLVYLMRITKLPLQDLFRHQISFWVRNIFFYEHRINNYLIPRKSEIREMKKGGISKSIIEGKGFKGAYVIPPVPGIHFNVVVADFSSLYPSIIKTRNLSYETINCPHEECKNNLLPDTPYYVCSKRVGIFALVVGFLRDIRVKWFKPRSSDKSLPEQERNFAKVLQSALKVFINGSYGVFGSEQFPLFCLPVAESTTAIGRYAIKRTIEKCESMGIRVLYGDTDSVFLDNPPPEKVEELIKWSREELNIDLEEEKTYQFLALSERKKNYIGIYKDSLYIDIKGMTGKKTNTPPFIKKAFNEVSEILKHITNPEEFKKSRKDIINLIKSYIKKIGKPEEKGGFPIKDYAITVILKKNPDKYESQTQHLKAARMEEQFTHKKLEKGDRVTFIKAKNAEGVKPLSMASLNDVDIDKYKELMKSTFEQILDALNISYDELEGIRKLDAFF
ncbi:MAG: DNA-directed DNA polymerase I [Promethearchaeota archaeon]